MKASPSSSIYTLSSRSWIQIPLSHFHLFHCFLLSIWVLRSSGKALATCSRAQLFVFIYSESTWNQMILKWPNRTDSETSNWLTKKSANLTQTGILHLCVSSAFEYDSICWLSPHSLAHYFLCFFLLCCLFWRVTFFYYSPFPLPPCPQSCVLSLSPWAFFSLGDFFLAKIWFTIDINSSSSQQITSLETGKLKCGTDKYPTGATVTCSLRAS